jgi:hypothetical protein
LPLVFGRALAMERDSLNAQPFHVVDLILHQAEQRRPVILLDWTGLDFEVGSSPVQCTGLGAPGAPMQIQFSKWIRSIPHFAKRVAARFTAESILVQCCCGMYLTSITLVTASPPE